MDLESLRKAIEDEEALLARLDRECQNALDRLLALREQYRAAASFAPPPAEPQPLSVRTPATAEDKVALFRGLFRGREDVYPKYWRNEKTGRSGYSPACSDEWVRGLCEKPRVKCGECPSRSFLPVTDQVILDHLQGRHVIGVYPLLPDETCRFLAVDFDKQSWKEDAPRSWKRAVRTRFPRIWSAPVPETAHTSGISLSQRLRRLSRGRWVAP